MLNSICVITAVVLLCGPVSAQLTARPEYLDRARIQHGDSLITVVAKDPDRALSVPVRVHDSRRHLLQKWVVHDLFFCRHSDSVASPCKLSVIPRGFGRR